MTGKTDVRVRAKLTYTVTTYNVEGAALGSQEIASGMRLSGANAIARAVHGDQDQPGELTTLKFSKGEAAFDEGSWLAGAHQALAKHAPGTLLLLELPGTGQPSRVGVTFIIPETTVTAAAGDEKVSNPAQGVVDTLKDRLSREISRINLPERWEDLSRETTRRGLEAFMAIQMAGKEAWRDHEIEGMVNRIALRTGKAKIDLRRMIESAQERVAEAQRGEQVRADLNEREVHYCRNRAKGLTPDQAARYAGYQHPYAASAALLEANPRVKRRIAQEQEKVQAEAVRVAGTQRLENASQEFFALNVGFYGMTVEEAAKQMSLPLPAADGLMAEPIVQERIKFFQRCNARGRKA